MSTEPRWLIGGPDTPEPVTGYALPPKELAAPQQAVPKVTKPKPSRAKVEGTYKGKTADQWRDMAKRSESKRQESIDRSDTDGALSQMGHNLNAREYRLCAELAERDGLWEFHALFTLTGALVPDAVYIKTKQGKWVWRIGKGDGAQWFNESIAKDGFRRRKNDAAKGFYVGTVRARGFVGTAGSGRGTGNLTSVGYFIGRVDSSPVEIIDNGIGDMNLGIQYQDEK